MKMMRFLTEYYSHLKGELKRDELFEKFPVQAEHAKNEAWQATLGEISEETIDYRISDALGGVSKWILVGGPPCQAYSLVGRSRNQLKDGLDKK